MDNFKLHSEYQPTGDQPHAIEELVKGFKTGKTKVILVLNKIDLLENKEDLIAVIAEYSKWPMS